jgi:hypothetical protein
MTYFANCHTSEEIKTEYRRLAMLHHPDHGGNVQTMQEINAAYSFAIASATRSEKPGKTAQEYADLDAVNEAIRATLEKIIRLPGIKIEICGLWLWVSGETKPVKDHLKAAGLRWAPKKEQWYFAGVPASGRGQSMEHIRNRYGSRVVTREEERRLS